MTTLWSVVSEAEALSYGGTPARTYAADGVTYVVGPLATLIILDAGDRPQGSAVRNVDYLVVREPFTEVVDARLQSWDLPKLGFVRVPEGYVPLGELGSGRDELRHIDDGGPRWPFGGRVALISSELRIRNRLAFDVLDRVRPTPERALPDVDWLWLLHLNPIAALDQYVAGWYADIPPARQWFGRPARDLPEPLVAFYRAAAGRREIHGLQNSIFSADTLQEDDDGLVTFGSENQGVFEFAMDPSDPDPSVRCDLGTAGKYEREPLSRFLVQFLLFEAACASPYGACARVTTDQAERLVEPLTRVPLRPLRWPADPTRFAIARGVVVMTSALSDGSVGVNAGSRHRCGLRPLREPGFVWERFDG